MRDWPSHGSTVGGARSLFRVVASAVSLWPRRSAGSLLSKTGKRRDKVCRPGRRSGCGARPGGYGTAGGRKHKEGGDTPFGLSGERRLWWWGVADRNGVLMMPREARRNGSGPKVQVAVRRALTELTAFAGTLGQGLRPRVAHPCCQLQQRNDAGQGACSSGSVWRSIIPQMPLSHPTDIDLLCSYRLASSFRNEIISCMWSSRSPR